MKKTLIRHGIRLIITIALIVMFYEGYSYWLSCQIDKLYEERKLSVNHAAGLAEKDKGSVLPRQSLHECNLVFLGSSELNSMVPENPKYLMPNNLYEGDASFFGHAGVQNALHAMNLGANLESFKGKDIVIVESLQWFMGTDIHPDSFFSNFSELQMYEFLHNECIPDQSKRYLCNRYIQLENTRSVNLYDRITGIASSDGVWNHLNSLIFSRAETIGISLVEGDPAFQESYIQARSYLGDNIIDKSMGVLLTPYYWMRYKIQLLKDKYDTYNWLKSFSPESERKVINIEWDRLLETAEYEGIEACKYNDIYVNDEYWRKYLKENWNELKGKDQYTELSISHEWDDYYFLLNLCNELNINLYVVSMSTNGVYYDYIGIDKNKRDFLYDKIESMSHYQGFNCLKMADKEYEPYFYCDVMHLGWKGWPYVLQKVYKNFSE